MFSIFSNRSSKQPFKEKGFPGYLGIPGFPVGSETAPVTPEKSAVLLCSASERLWKASSAHVESLTSALNHVPLALYTAARLLEERRSLSFEGYQKAVEQAEDKLPVGSPDIPSGGSLPKDRRLMAALLLSFRLLDGASKPAALARAVFLTAGCCAPNHPIPTRMLRAALGAAASPPLVLENALDRLYDLGLLRWSENGPIILEVTAQLARRLDEKDNKALDRLVQAGLKICSEETDNRDCGPLLVQMAPHLQSSAQHVEKTDTSLSARLWNQLGHAFWTHYEHSHAQRCFEQALLLDERMYGTDHTDVAADCSILGQVLHEIGEFAEAKKYYLRAIQITEAVFSPSYPGIAENAVRLGRLLHETGELHDARVLYERALAIHQKSFEYGPRHPSTASDLHQLGLVLYDLGLWEEAKSYFERALAVHEWFYGAYHHTVHADLTQLGKTLRAAGQLGEARTCFERVIQIEKRISDSPDYNDPATLNNLGLILQDMDCLPEAKKYFERALRIDEDTLGPDHPNVARDANNLGCVLRDMNILPEAQGFFERAAAINKIARGPEHRDVAVNLSNLGRVLFAMNDLSGARECFERVLAIDEKVYGPQHLEVANDRANLGTVLHELGELSAAHDFYTQAQAIYERTLPNDHPKLISVQKSYARLKQQIQA